MSGWTPHGVFRAVAVTEAVTWGLLLTGMVLKYVTETTELGVQVFGMVHGVVFIAYCLFESYADRRGLLGREWLSREDSPTARRRAVCWLLRHHRLAAGLLVVAVAGLTGAALVVGPPA